MECGQDGTGLLWLEGERDSPLKSSSSPNPRMHTIPWVYSEPAELKVPSPETESVR